MGKNVFQKCYRIAFGSPQTIENNIVAKLLTHQISLCHQPLHGGFTAKITGFSNMVCMVNHTMEDL